MLAPGSPAWMVTRSADDARSAPSSRATSTIRSAYVGVDSSTVASSSMTLRTRCSVLIPAPEMASAPSRSAPPNADQNPMNGPNENAKKTRSPGPKPAARYTWSDQMDSHQAHDSGVSSQRSGRSPLDPDVWCTRTYRSIGYVRLVPKGGCAAWSAISSPFVVSGCRAKSSQPRNDVSRERQNAFARNKSETPACSRASCKARSSSTSAGEGAVSNLEHRVQDLEPLIELGLGDAQRRVGHDHVPPQEGVHARIDQG